MGMCSLNMKQRQHVDLLCSLSSSSLSGVYFAKGEARDRRVDYCEAIA